MAPRKRSNAPRFPRYDLNSSVEVARVLHDKAGGSASTKVLATYLGYTSAANGAFLYRMAAARLFGLVDGAPSDIRPTPRAEQILRPDYPEVEVRARAEAFAEVPLFSAFLQEYEGKMLPPREGMLNALRSSRYGIEKNLATIALDRMLDSADQAGYFTVTNGARTKMLRPPIGRPQAAQAASPAETVLAVESVVSVSSRGKLVDGVLELLPQGEEWEEALLQDWLRMLTMALRVRYKLASPAAAKEVV
jgi:hypothetical protein